MRRGFLLGKFYPPHSGHHYLIERALEQCDRLDIALLWGRHETMDPQTRYYILREMHPDATVWMAEDNNETNYDDPEVWDRHMEVILREMPIVKNADVVFSSELYGAELARRLDAEHVMVDYKREFRPISATMVRENTAWYWDELAAPTKAALTKRICLLGSESTGTTTLTRALAKHYQTSWAPEFGHLYAEGVGMHHNWTHLEFMHIAATQRQLEDYMARAAGPVMFCDTNPLATTVWHGRYMRGQRGFESNARVLSTMTKGKYDLYLVTDHYDVPFVQDGTRDGEDQREWMTEAFFDVARQTGTRTVLLKGSEKDRFRAAVDLVDELLAKGWEWASPI